MLKTADFDFDLPKELIAQYPLSNKEETNMLVSDCKNNIIDKQVIDIIDYVNNGDVLVFNDVKVIKAKLKATNNRNLSSINLNLDQEISSDHDNCRWQALCKPAKKVKQNDILVISDDFLVRVEEKLDNGFLILNFDFCRNDLFKKLEKYGEVPLPPYIKRDQKDKNDVKNYQTIYAKNGQAVAAPTAGLHFNQNILDKLIDKGAKIAYVTLNVGAGTFLPVKSENISDHKMHSEFYNISKQTASIINRAKIEGKKIFAIGTTSLRVLESVANNDGEVRSDIGNTNIFIYPPYQFKIVDVLFTNFHLPKSTLFMLVCAFLGKENAIKLYNHAIAKKYRFFSYGDSSLLIRNSI